MDKWPQPFWAVLLALLGCITALAVLLHTSTAENIALGVLTVSSNLVSGALGAFAGAAHAAKQTDITAGSAVVNQGDAPAPKFSK